MFLIFPMGWGGGSDSPSMFVRISDFVSSFFAFRLRRRPYFVFSFVLPSFLRESCIFRNGRRPQWFNVGARKEGIRTSPDGHRICRGSVSNSSPMFFPLPFPRSPQSSWYACRGWAPVPRCLATSPLGYWLSVSDVFPSPPPGSPCPTPYRPRPALPLLGPSLPGFDHRPHVVLLAVLKG